MAERELRFRVSADDTEAIAAMRRIGGAVEEAGRKVEEFGRKKGVAKLEADAASAELTITQITRKLEELKARKTDPKIDADITAAIAKFTDVKARLDALDRTRTNPVIDAKIDTVKAKIDEITAQLRKLGDQRLSPVVTLQTALLTQDLSRANAELDKLNAHNVDPRVALEVTEFERQKAEIVAELETLSARKTELSVDAKITLAEDKLGKIAVKLDELEARKTDPIIDLQIDAAETKIAKLNERLRYISDQTWDIRLQAEAAQARLTIEELQRKLVELSASRADPVVGAQILEWTAKKTLVEEELRVLNAQKANPVIDAEITALLAKRAAAQEALDTIHDKQVKIDADTTSATSNIFALSSVIMGLGSAIVPVAAAVVGLGGALLTMLPGAISGAVALKLGFQGIGQAIKDYSSMQDAAAADATKAAATQAAAADKVASAQQNLVNAQQRVGAAQSAAADGAISAAERVQKAQQGIANAQQAAADSAVSSADRIKTAQENVATVTAAAADANVAAADRVKSAQEGVATAVEASASSVQAALDRVKSAEEALQTAQENELTAQQNLTDARKTAQEQAEQLAFSVQDIALAERGAQIRLEEARAKVQADAASASVTDLQRRKDLLALDEAQQHLIETQHKGIDLNAQQQASNQAGIEGSKGVIAAQKGVANSIDGVGKAQDALAKAQAGVATAQANGADRIAKAQDALARAQEAATKTQESGAARIAKAQEAVAAAQVASGRAQEKSQQAVANAVQALGDAQRAQARQAETSAASVASAQQGVAKAQEALAKAQEAVTAATDKTSTAAAKFAKSMADLTPAGQSFVTFYTTSFKPMLDDIQKVAQTGLMPGMEQGLRNLTPALGGISAYLGVVSIALGKLATDAGAAFNSPVWAHFIDYMTNIAPYAIKTFGSIMGSTFAGFAGLAQAFEPAFRGIGDWLVKLTDQFAAFGQSTTFHGNDGFSKLLAYIMQAGPVVVSVLGEVAKTIYTIATGLAGIGLGTLQALEYLLKSINSVNPGALTALAAGFAAFKLAGLIAGPMKNLAVSILGVAASANGATTAVQGFASKAGDATTKFTGMGAVGKEVEKDISRLGTVFSKLGNNLPLIGLAIVALGFVYDGFRNKSDDLSKSVINGSQSFRQAVDQETKQIENRNLLFDLGNAKFDIFASAEAKAKQGARDHAEAVKQVTQALKDNLDQLGPVERANANLTIAEDAYQEVLKHNTANSMAGLQAARDVKQAKEDQTRATQLNSDALKTDTQRIIDNTNAQDAAAHSDIAYQQSQFATTDAIKAVTTAQHDGTSSAEDIAKAQLSAKDAAFGQADAARRLAEDQAKATGATDVGAIGAKAYKDELQKLADKTTGPLHDALQNQIDALGKTQTAVDNTNTKTGDLQTADTHLVSYLQGPMSDAQRDQMNKNDEHAKHIKGVFDATDAATKKAMDFGAELTGPLAHDEGQAGLNLDALGRKHDDATKRTGDQMAKLDGLGAQLVGPFASDIQNTIGRLSDLAKAHLTDEQRAQLQKDELQRLADKTRGPLHDAIMGMIGDLHTIPPDTRFNVTADGSLGAWQAANPQLFAVLADGGVMPGYSPGVDNHTFYSATAGRLELSGGEAVMRPEWTQAMGPDYVSAANTAARTGGTQGVRSFLTQRGFADGGVVGAELPTQSFAYGGLTMTGVPYHPDMESNRYHVGARLEGERLAAYIKQEMDAAKKYWAASGGAATLAWARTQVGKPYIWGGVGPNGYDCSGFLSALVNVSEHKNPYSRIGSTANFPWPGFLPGIGPGLSIGSTNNGVGHMAGTLCIIGNMLIDGPNGPRRIDEIQPGEWVWSFDNGRRKPHQVVEAWFTARQDVFEVRTSKGRSVTGSANHPFLVARKQADCHWGQVEMEAGAEWAASSVERQPYGAAGVLACSVSTCDRRVVAKLLCRRHHAMLVKYGDPRLKRRAIRAKWDVEWVRLDDLQRGDFVVRSRATEDGGTATTLPDGREVTEDTAWLIGHLVGDGNMVDRPGRIRVSCYKDEYRDHTLRAWKALTGKDGVFRGYDSTSPPVTLQDRPTHEVFRQMGMCVKGPVKRVPAAVWSWPRHLQRAFLDGYADADGHYPGVKKPYVLRRYGSASERLIAEVRAMHIAHGDGVSNVEHRKSGPSRSNFAGSGDGWSFDVYAGARDDGGTKGLEGLRDLVDSWGGEYTLSRVQTITPRGAQDTYDITVEGSHSFSVDGIQLHNSGVNVESNGSQGVVVGGSTGASSSMFQTRAHMPLRGGSSGGGVGGGGPAPVGAINNWIMSALGIEGYPGFYAAGLYQQIMTESGGNPRAINNWDSNAAAGHPSKGIMQVIDGTFRANAAPGHGDIWNPVDNIAAGAHYAMGRYGPGWFSPGPQHQHGYDGGGIANGRGMMMKDVIRPERVLSPAQTDSFERLVAWLTTNRGSTVPARNDGGVGMASELRDIRTMLRGLLSEPRVLNMPIYNPHTEDGADSVAAAARTASSLGLFGRR